MKRKKKTLSVADGLLLSPKQRKKLPQWSQDLLADIDKRVMKVILEDIFNEPRR